jgi:hypothetical protein
MEKATPARSQDAIGVKIAGRARNSRFCHSPAGGAAAPMTDL